MAGVVDLLMKQQSDRAKFAEYEPTPPPKFGQAIKPAAPPITPQEADRATASEASLGLSAGFEQTKGMLKSGMAAVADMFNQDSAAAGLRKSAQANFGEAQDITSHSYAPQSISEVRGPSDFANYALSGVSRQIPQFGAMAAGALVGRGAGVTAMATGLNVGANYEQGNAEIDELVKSGRVDPQREAQLRDRVLTASGLAGILQGGLDRLGFGAVAPKLVGGVARTLKPHILRAIGTEGATEAVQEYIGMAATKLALEQPDAFGITQQELTQLADAGILGGLTGGAMSVPGASLPYAGQALDAGIDLAARGIKAARDNPTLQRGLQAGDDLVTRAMTGMKQGAQAAPAAAKATSDDFLAKLKPYYDAFAQSYANSAETPTIDAFAEQVKQYIPDVDLSAEGIARAADTAAKTAGEWAGRAAPAAGDAMGRAASSADRFAQGVGTGFTEGADRQTFSAGAWEAGAAAGSMASRVGDTLRAAKEAGAQSAADVYQWVKEQTKRDGTILDADGFVQKVKDFFKGDTPKKQSLFGRKDVTVMQSILDDLPVKLRPDDRNFVARRMADLFQDEERLRQFVGDEAVARDLFSMVGLHPEEFLTLVGSKFEEAGVSWSQHALSRLEEQAIPAPQATESEEGVPLTPDARADADEAVEVDEYADQGITAQTDDQLPSNARDFDNMFQKAVLNRADRYTKGDPKGTRWVILEKRALDPETGQPTGEVEQVEHQVNMMQLARSQARTRQDATNVDGSPVVGVQRNDRNFLEGIGQLFMPWQEEGVEYRVVPAKKHTAALTKDVTVNPVDDLNEWLREGDIVIGRKGGKDRKLTDAVADEQQRFAGADYGRTGGSDLEGADVEPSAEKIAEEDQYEKIVRTPVEEFIKGATEKYNPGDIAVDTTPDVDSVGEFIDRHGQRQAMGPSGTTISGKGGLRMTDKPGPQTEDYSNQYIDYARTGTRKPGPTDIGDTPVQEIPAGLERADANRAIREHQQRLDDIEKRAEHRSQLRASARKWLDNPELVRGIKIEREVLVEDTGETARVSEDAADVLADIKQRDEILRKLQECLA